MRDSYGEKRRGRAWRRLVRVLPWLLLGLAAADWLLMRSGAWPHPPWALAALVIAALASLLGQLASGVWEVWSGSAPRGAGVGRALVVGGILLALSAGLANWLLSLQGYVILHEGEAVPLRGGAHLQHFDSGPLSRVQEMDLLLGLVETEVRLADDGSIDPMSLLEVKRGDSEPVRLRVDPRESASSGSLRFFQGAFGFAPRIVVLEGGETLFDEVVPFTTARRAERGISFEGRFELEKENLHFDGAVDLASLDEALRGHATLHLTVRRGNRLLGRGSLLPGHFAEIGHDYRIGFAGLKKWSEIDISRRHYGRFVMAGATITLLGAFLWPIAAWRKW